MQISQTLALLMQERGVSAYKISKDTGISDRLIGYWRNGDKLPGAENLLTIANYFNVSVDYLLTGKEKVSITPHLTSKQQECLDRFDRLLEIDQGRILERMENIYDSYLPEQK